MVIATLSFPLPSPPSIPTSNPNPRPSPPPRSRLLRCPCATDNNNSWGSNAEDVGSGRFRFRDRGIGGDGAFQEKTKRKWWSDEWRDEFDEEDDFFDDEPESLWDKIWIFKVFKSYGYFLPAIIASMLLATGPKAFLMAMALPLGQSALALAFDSLWGKERQRPASRSKGKGKPFYRTNNDFRREEEEKSTRANQARQDYQSWAAGGGGRPEPRTGSFGGWDELDRNKEFRTSSSWKSPPRPTAGSVSRTQSMKRGKLSRGGKRKDTPLFLRLLIAVFPFLDSWIRFL